MSVRPDVGVQRELPPHLELVSRERAQAIGMVIPSLRQAYVAQAVEGIQSGLASGGYTMLLASSDRDADAELNAVHAMLAQGVDGLILFGRSRQAQSARAAQRVGIPVLRGWVGAADSVSMAFDHDAAYAGMTRHLLALGHRAIVVTIPFRALGDALRSRLAAIRAELACAGVAQGPLAVIDDLGVGIDAGRQALRRVRECHARATAMLCGNDLIAAGVILEARRLGIDVPRDLTVTGYHDLEIAAALQPSITTVRTPADILAERVARGMLDWLGTDQPPPSLELATELLVRESSARPRRAARLRPS